MSVEASPGGAAGQQFKCPNCNGPMVYDPAVQALRCSYCKHTMAPPAGPAAQQGPASPGPGAPMSAPAMGGGPGPREIALSEGLARAPRGLGAPVQAFSCKDCGATVSVGVNERTANCTYCASATVIAVASDPNQITPESLVPFQVPREKAGELFKDWLRGLWFRPSNLRHMARLEQIAGVYVPYWTFDANVYSDWTAERGWYYYETEEYTAQENGETVVRTREIQRTRWESAWGSRQDHFDDVLVCGSRGMPEKLVDKFTTFNTGMLVAYNPGYLAGWRAESYAVDLPVAWTKAQEKIAVTQRGRCGSDVGGDTHQGLSVNNRFSNETFKHVLLPVYVAAYRYQDKPYRFLVNGQTGEIVGEAPYSFWKIFFLVAFIVSAIVLGVLIWRAVDDGPDGQQTAPQLQQYQQFPQQQFPQPGTYPPQQYPTQQYPQPGVYPQQQFQPPPR